MNRPKKKTCQFCTKPATEEIQVWVHRDWVKKPTCKRHGKPTGMNYTPDLKEFGVYRVDQFKYPDYNHFAPRFQYEVWSGNHFWSVWYKQKDAVSSARNEEAMQIHLKENARANTR